MKGVNMKYVWRVSSTSEMAWWKDGFCWWSWRNCPFGIGAMTGSSTAKKTVQNTSWASQNNVWTPDWPHWPCPINLTNWDFTFWHGVIHALIDTLAACPSFSFSFLKRYHWSKKQKMQNRPKLAKKNKKQRGQAASIFARMYGRFEHGLKFQSKMIKIGRGIAVMPVLSLLLDSSIESSFGHISWWVANWAMKLISAFLLCL